MAIKSHEHRNLSELNTPTNGCEWSLSGHVRERPPRRWWQVSESNFEILNKLRIYIDINRWENGVDWRAIIKQLVGAFV